MRLAAIALGGALGTLARAAALAAAAHPATLLAVNVSGAFLLGLWWGAVEARRVNASLTPLIATGTLGSFTTFSAWTHTLIGPWESPWAAVAYGAVSVAFGMAAAGAGYAWGRSR